LLSNVVSWHVILEASSDDGLTSTVILIPLHVVPIGGLFVAAAFKALGTARYLHKPVCLTSCMCCCSVNPTSQYFRSKNMTKVQVAVFIAEHQWDYLCEYELLGL